MRSGITVLSVQAIAKLTLEELRERMLTGDYPRLDRMRRVWGALPSPPRCKLCNAPFRGSGGILMRTIGYGPSPLNRRLCNACIRKIHKRPGGAEVEISVLFADVRASTSMAERMVPQEFSRLMARFYGAAAKAVDECDGIVDKFAGDGALALFIPGFAGSDHAADQTQPHGASSSKPVTTRSCGSRSVLACTREHPSSMLLGKAMSGTSPRWETRSTLAGG
jgi:hypothetical protein